MNRDGLQEEHFNLLKGLRELLVAYDTPNDALVEEIVAKLNELLEREKRDE